METFMLVVHVVLAVMLIGLVLLQQGKGADMGAVMGGGGSGSLFGVAGASNVLLKATTSVAILFMFSAILLIRLSNTTRVGTPGGNELDGSIMQGVVTKENSAQTLPSAGSGDTQTSDSAAPAAGSEQPAQPAVPVPAAPAANPEPSK